MSWDGTVRCSWCHGRGHNRASCPSRKEHIKNNPDGYEARQEAKRLSRKVTRTCSYCREPGHNRKTCEALRSDRQKLFAVDKDYRTRFVEALQSCGLGIGSLVRCNDTVEINWAERVPVSYAYLINSINTDVIDITMRAEDISNSYSLHRRRILEVTVASVSMSEEDKAKCREARSQDSGGYSSRNYGGTHPLGKRTYISLGDIVPLLPTELFEGTNDEWLSKKSKDAEVLSISSAIPDRVKFEALNREPRMDLLYSLNIIPRDNKDPWDKERQHNNRLKRYLGENIYET